MNDKHKYETARWLFPLVTASKYAVQRDVYEKYAK